MEVVTSYLDGTVRYCILRDNKVTSYVEACEGRISVHIGGTLMTGLPPTEEGLLLHTLLCAALYQAPGNRLSKMCRVRLAPYSCFENDILAMY